MSRSSSSSPGATRCDHARRQWRTRVSLADDDGLEPGWRVVLVTAAVLTFKLQNLDTVTVRFPTASLTVPVSILILVIYVLGMATGSAALALLKSWIAGARRSTQ